MEEIIQSILAISNNDNEDILRKLLERLQGKAIAEGMRRYERKLSQSSTGGKERETIVWTVKNEMGQIWHMARSEEEAIEMMEKSAAEYTFHDFEIDSEEI